ncbi:RNA polymerase sigma factor [Desulfonispora thiosulfatigenes DSM 11270]|uniref:RNA polymerase sigma factor SigI n=1 Tax=Desulfonispora thiosulfatigenes DSM 11270 TaxID=656914 RepID=A0A1W1VBU0_DESTI|nr:RNA polymerase sigma-I factor [Desulfonispora thiosulfatigenes]SMB90660.1 RNA polymerase sigma factor [Desulfonispora thiosulfatigenes DSM 11270]
MESIRKFICLIQKGDSLKRERIINEYKGQIHLWANMYCKRYLDWSNDDELSIALGAFNEAIDSFEIKKGSNFLAYAKIVIRNKLIDYFKKEKRHQCLPLEIECNDDKFTPFEIKTAEENYQRETERNERVEEIKLYQERLCEYGLSFSDLVNIAPKHKDTRQSLIKAANILVEEEELAIKLKRTKRLPIKELMIKTGLSRKVLESGRKYIISVAIILFENEFYYLNNFIQRGTYNEE